MGLFEILAVLITLSAVFSYVNHRFVGLPTTIGVMAIALVMSLALIGLHEVGWNLDESAERILERIDFSEALMHGMLGFLLFAGALHVNINDLAGQRWVIGSLATGGVVLSTFLIGGGTWLVLRVVGLDVGFEPCLLFGALISPTDPIAVLGILKQAKVPKSLETKITGESLFNDGVGVVVFIILLGIATGGDDMTAGHVALLFLEEAVGGAVFGLALGLATYYLLKSVNAYSVEVLLTLALVTGGYALAGAIHVSGPIAIVVAGLLIGNHGRRLAMSEKTREHLDTFWELIDEILNAVLFVLIGLEVLILTFEGRPVLAGMLMIPVVLLARFLSVGTTVTVLRTRRTFSRGAIPMLTWGGLRGGISVALALSLPKDQGLERPVLLTITYIVVVFSIIVQGLTVGRLARRYATTDSGH